MYTVCMVGLDVHARVPLHMLNHDAIGFVPSTDTPLAVRPHDRLMLECPLPQPLDEVMRARLLLLQERGLLPQVFLPDLPGLPDALGSGPGPVATVQVPEDVMQTLRVLVMEPSRLAVALEGDEADDLTPGVRFAVVVCMPLHECSGAWWAGLGHVEHPDAAAGGAGDAAGRGRGDGDAGAGPAAAGGARVDVVAYSHSVHRQDVQEDDALQHALLYRIKQKQLARAWLLLVRSRVNSTMAELRAQMEPNRSIE